MQDRSMPAGDELRQRQAVNDLLAVTEHWGRRLDPDTAVFSMIAAVQARMLWFGEKEFGAGWSADLWTSEDVQALLGQPCEGRRR